MTQHPPADHRLSVTPALEPGDAAFLAGFARQPGAMARIWPGQPAVASPWVPCDQGCCLLPVPRGANVDTAGQWLRFIIREFLGDAHRVDGWVGVAGPLGRGACLLIVEAGDVFEGVAS
ncbi:hypothetical protein [Nocardioides sp. B-3]|uniref:hypothetical protein n=1 Tax=Nocardioides sp. B-3 TaxID=2895565 RepID=UPI002152DF5A|nr:hypothetical protein [Nocardioides sp. B-3]UUZ60517.1 hypothetical protein LP418_06495 [Nocardioides sp. B-3]